MVDSNNPGGSWDYVDFALEVREGSGRNQYILSVRSPAGETQEEMSFPFESFELENRLLTIENAILRSGTTRRRIRSPEEQTVQDFGRNLFDTLLAGEARPLYAMSLSDAKRQNKGLRVKLHIRPPELARLPWEFLYDPGRDEYVCLSAKTPLVRYLDLPQSVEKLTVAPPLRVLGMVASPGDLDALDVQNEKRLVEAATRDLQADGLVELTWLEGQTWKDLQRAMRRGPWHVFHFVGHGGFDRKRDEGAIALSDEGGGGRLLSATRLARLLDDHYPLRLVLLNSCEGAAGGERDAFSSTAATLVRRGIPAVVAMQYEITDEAAIEFSRDFYEAVADGLPVDAAVAEARTAVSMGSSLEWGTPVLYMRSPDGRIFDVLAQPRGGERPDPLRRYREAVEAAWANEGLTRGEAERLDELARKLALDPDTAADLEREIMGETKEDVLKRLELQKRLTRMYARARRLHGAREWQLVVQAFDEMRALDPAYPDPEGLLMSAREALAELRLVQKVAAAYEQGLQYMDAEEWSQALRCFEEIQRLQTGYRKTDALLAQVRRALDREAGEERKLEEYRESVELCWGDGRLSHAEVVRLINLRRRLELSSEAATGIERGVTGSTVEELLEKTRGFYAHLLTVGWKEGKLADLGRMPRASLDALLEDPRSFREQETPDSPVDAATRSGLVGDVPWPAFVAAVRLATDTALPPATVAKHLRSLAGELGLSEEEAVVIEGDVLGKTVEEVVRRAREDQRAATRRAADPSPYARPDTLPGEPLDGSTEGEEPVGDRRRSVAEDGPEAAPGTPKEAGRPRGEHKIEPDVPSDRSPNIEQRVESGTEEETADQEDSREKQGGDMPPKPRFLPGEGGTGAADKPRDLPD